ncbi:MAG: Stp1/IreP family PP2C-type Ser/Thr phosphatase [Chloroflexia bacterium]
MPFGKRRRKPEPEAGHTLAFGLRRDIGRVRENNEDQLLAFLAALPGAMEPHPVGLFLVADGLGGHAGGEVASRRAVELVAAQALRRLVLPALEGEPPEAVQDVLREAVEEANRRIWEEAQAAQSDMGTTLTVALVAGGHLHVAHVGDSRLYTYGAEGLRCRTRDHSLVGRLLELGQLRPEEARHHPQRNYLYQSVGQGRDLEVDVASYPLEGCRYLLLCTDGLWGYVEDDEIAQLLASGGDPQLLCDQLVDRANAAGGEDNISVIVVSFPPSRR